MDNPWLYNVLGVADLYWSAIPFQGNTHSWPHWRTLQRALVSVQGFCSCVRGHSYSPWLAPVNTKQFEKQNTEKFWRSTSIHCKELLLYIYVCVCLCAFVFCFHALSGKKCSHFMAKNRVKLFVTAMWSVMLFSFFGLYIYIYTLTGHLNTPPCICIVCPIYQLHFPYNCTL